MSEMSDAKGDVGEIYLTDDERGLLEHIEFDSRGHDHDVHLKNAETVPKLMDLLIKRRGIPKHRVNWFTDPEYKRGRIKGSRQHIFERNGTTGRDIFQHAHFLKHLHYFIYGANLPHAAIQEFSAFVRRYEPIGSDDVGDLLKLSKELVNKFSIEPHEAAEEIFKLALDCGVPLMWAQHLEEYVAKMKLRKNR